MAEIKTILLTLVNLTFSAKPEFFFQFGAGTKARREERKAQQPAQDSYAQRARRKKGTGTNEIEENIKTYQEVVMRVALHCQGCAGKVKKHLSKMEGVTSFSIDLETKMVTVRGHVSPVGVVESISKVKKAELLPCS